MTVAIIDGDIVGYRCAASAENNELEIALIRASRTLQDIVSVTGCNEIRLFLSGSRNFRYDLYPEYKANRRTMIRPKWLNQVKEFLVLEWGAEVADGIEADDAIGIHNRPDAVICSMDKDLKQLSGVHFNFVTDEWEVVSVFDAHRNFYRQLLTGDRGDNVPGIRGIGKVKSARIIDVCSDELEMYSVVRKIYNDDETLLRNARLLYIWRKENDLWMPPTNRGLTSEGKQETEQKSESTPMTQVESIPSTEHGGTQQKQDGSPVLGPRMDLSSEKTNQEPST